MQTVKKAIDASRPESSTQISDSKQAVRDVSESQDEYCDTSASADIVMAATDTTGIGIWVPRDTADPGAFLQDKMSTITLFAHGIVMPLARVFGLAPRVMNIFWDHTGPLIAFNRGGAIFCNARYFSSWHAQAAQRGELNTALISWYFSIAHGMS